MPRAGLFVRSDIPVTPCRVHRFARECRFAQKCAWPSHCYHLDAGDGWLRLPRV